VLLLSNITDSKCDALYGCLRPQGTAVKTVKIVMPMLTPIAQAALLLLLLTGLGTEVAGMNAYDMQLSLSNTFCLLLAAIGP
jgi:hypothetical protein